MSSQPMDFAGRAAIVTQYGIPVMPLLPRQKRAFLENWPTLATIDADQIARWNKENPKYNCGAVGLPGGSWIFEVDNPSLYARLEKETGHNLDELDTLVVKSSGEKRHFYLKHDSRSESLGNFSADDEAGEIFSVRACNAYVVGPGSIHPDTGQPYEIVAEPTWGEIPTAPDWLMDWLIPYSKKSGTPKSTKLPEVIPMHSRNKTFASLAGVMRRKGANEAEILVTLREANKRCQVPMTDREMAKIAGSVAKYAPAQDEISGKESNEPTNIRSASKELEFHLPAVMTGTNYDFVIEPAHGQTDGWFPLGSPSLIGGSSGSNKSTWMMHLLLAQLRREPFLGHPTYGRPYLVLMADRGEASHQRTMRRMRMEHESVPIKFLSLQTGTAALQEIVDKIEETSPLPQIVFIEGCDMLVEDANKKQIVGPFMGALQKIATYYHLAIAGSVGAPKCKAGEGYVAKRDNISGTEAWSRLSETVVLLQYPKGNDTASERELTVLPRNAPAESFVMVMKHGRLELQTEEDRRRAEGRDREIDWVQAQNRLAKDDPTKRWWTALDMRQALELPKTTAYDWVQNASDKGHIIEKPGKKGRGKKALYRWNDSKTNPLWIEHESDQNEMYI